VPQFSPRSLFLRNTRRIVFGLSAAVKPGGGSRLANSSHDLGHVFEIILI